MLKTHRIDTTLTEASDVLAETGISSHRLDSELLLAAVTERPRSWLLAHADEELTASQIERFNTLVRRRATREPLVHLTGRREFYGLELMITPDVLTPRVETEQMVEWALRYTRQGGHIIDVGTGSGAIAIALAHERPDLALTATEVSPVALGVARANAELHHTPVAFVESDLWNDVEGRFDTIVTNLPYLRDDAKSELMPEVTYEPAIALFGGSDGLSLYRRFLAGLPDHLADKGYLFTECDPWQHEVLVGEAARYGLRPVEQGYFILGFQYTKERA